jgi:hypothetical protein
VTTAAERPGVRHLTALARRPRPAGGAAEADARRYAAQTLASLGFETREERFEYSSFPGRFGTPLGGALLGATITTSGMLALAGRIGASTAVFLAGVALTGAFAWWMLGDGVLEVPWHRESGVNLAAVRGDAKPQVWLVAHLDSKSQLVPSATRVGGVVLLALSLFVAVAAMLMTLRGIDARTLWWVAVAVSIVGALPVMASVVGARSDGAVDNASGVATVLAAAALLPDGVACGVLLPSAEELGLAGARAWARSHGRAIALNCDGVDDEGRNVIMFNRGRPTRVVAALTAASVAQLDVRRMPLGLLTDSTALSARGWQAVTVSRGSLATLRRVHTRQDSLDTLRGDAIDDVAVILARAAEALAS